ncbi:MAG: hypothetical protein L0312_27480, partial [Acidobacteria bacterium]|nr:hypothetical protein [Acidobacteriota bacterium]
SLKRMEEGLTLARDLSEPHGLAHAFFFAAILHQLRREVRIVQEHADAAIAVSRAHGLVMHQAHALITRGWALVEQGLKAEGIEQMRQGLAAHEATGTEVMRPHFLACLAEALANTGQAEEGLRVLEQALSLVNRNGEKYYEPELYRLKGELLLMPSTGRSLSRAADATPTVVEAEPPLVAQAEGCFNQAIKIAQQQKAKSWELRAVISLARLYKKQNKQQEARVLLSQVYDRFTEGFDTMDLREAKALLDELS